MNEHHALWVEKYRPTSLDTYSFHDPAHKEFFETLIRNKTIPHLILSGVQGTGKTTIARILISAIVPDPYDRLTINASDESGIDTFRSKVRGFATTAPMGDFKVILLEEADRLTEPAQDALKAFSEQYSDTVRFILTCNDESKLSKPFQSRFQHIRFKAGDRDSILETGARVLMAEKVKCSLALLEQYVDKTYPDVRQMISQLQQHSVGGMLAPYPSSNLASAQYADSLIEELESGKWKQARDVLIANVAQDEWLEFYRMLYDRCQRSDVFNKAGVIEEVLVAIAEHMYKHSFCADSEINATACMIKIAQLRN